MMILSEVLKPNNFESYNSVKINFTANQSLCSLIKFRLILIILWIKVSWCSGFISGKLDVWIRSSNFTVRDYVPLIWKDCVTHMYGFVFYMKEGLPFARNWSLEKLRNLICFFNWLCFSDCRTFFSLSTKAFVFEHDPIWTSFCHSNHLLIYLSLEMLMSITRIG